jgi:hypothetical protein
MDEAVFCGNGIKIMVVRRLLVAIGTLFVVAFSIQVFLFVNRGSLQSTFTAASEDQLYAVSPGISNITHLGDGKLRLQLNNINGAVSAVASGNGSSVRVVGEVVEVQLAPGISDVQLKFKSSEEKLVFEYTAVETYKKGGLTEFPHGVVGLRHATSYVGQPVLKDIQDWDPNPNPNPNPNLNPNPNPNPNPNQWQQAELEMIGFLENKRGVPNDAAENASPDNLTNMIESNSSQVWCTEIARYMVNKLSDQTAVRLLGASGELGFGGVLTGGHSFMEVLDSSSNRWMFSDPTSYVVGVYWQDGMPVNAAEFQRLLGVRDPASLEHIQFLVADIVSKKLLRENWLQLPEKVRADWLFYFSPRNRIFYFSGSSAIHEKTLSKKVADWIRTDRKFILSPPSALPILAMLRVLSFWIMLISAVASGVLATLYLIKRNEEKS